MNSSTNMTATGVVKEGRWMYLTPTPEGGFCFFFGTVPQPVAYTMATPPVVEYVHTESQTQEMAQETSDNGQVVED